MIIKRKYEYVLILICILVLLFYGHNKIGSKINCIRARNKIINYLKNSYINAEKIFILFGSINTICSTCPIGEKIFNFIDEERVLYIFPKEFSLADIEVFRIYFPIRGKILIADIYWENLYNHICKCLKKDLSKKIHILIDINYGRKIKVKAIYISF